MKAAARPTVSDKEATSVIVRVGQQDVYLKLDCPRATRRPRSGETQERCFRLAALMSSQGEERVSWQDDENRSLETLLSDIAVEVIVAGDLQYREHCLQLHNWQIQRKAQYREYLRQQQEEAERRDRERRILMEKARTDRLLQDAASLRQAEDIRSYVETVRRISPVSVTTSALEQWCSWALAQADKIDPVKSGHFLKPGPPKWRIARLLNPRISSDKHPSRLQLDKYSCHLVQNTRIRPSSPCFTKLIGSFGATPAEISFQPP